MTPGNTLASCFLTCGVRLGATALASFSNWALVMTVLQSAGGVFAAGGFGGVAGLGEVAVAAAGLGCGGHTPTTVITAASAGTDAEVSTGAWAGCGGGGPLGAA